MKYLVDRLREPGTLRSLAVVLFGLLGVTPDNSAMEGYVQIGILVLGAVSALMPEKKAETVEAEAAKAVATENAVNTAVKAAQEIREVGATATQALNQANGLVERLRGLVR